MTRVSDHSAAELARLVSTKQISAREACDAAFAQRDLVRAGPEHLNIFLGHDCDWSRESAERLQLNDSGDALPLAGVPVAIKDNIATLHLPTTCGSRLLDGYVSPFEATAVARLRRAGATIIGKTNLDEFGMGSSTEHSAFGATRNPWDPSRVPGGSSGGSAAAVAAGICRIALGSETGGSVRQPAAFCGVVGIKPTYGRVSRYGLVAYASSLDHIGVFGASVADAALGLQVIAGHDALDATSVNQQVPDWSDAPVTSVKGMTIGCPLEYFPATLDPAVRGRVMAAVDALRDAGAHIVDVSLPHTELAIPTYYIIAPAEASSNLSRYDGVRYGQRAAADGLGAMYEQTRARGLGAEVTRRILLGTFVLSAGYYDAYYRQAMRVRALIANDFTQLFNRGIDALITPTTPTPAFLLGAVSDPYAMYLSDIFTVTANLVGIPAMSVPVGQVGGLPVGAQIMTRHFDEARMIAIGSTIERAFGVTRSPVAS